MRVHKSFIMSYGSKNKQKNIVIEVEAQEEAPEMVVEEITETKSSSASHFDQGAAISLEYVTYASEQSSSKIPDYYETYDEVDELSQGQARSYSLDDVEDAVIIDEKEKDEDLYSEANTYFQAEAMEKKKAIPFEEDATELYADDVLKKKTNVDTPANSVESQDSVSNEEVLAAHSETEDVENKKFEEDLQAIFAKKKVSDSEKAKLDPSESAKNKSKGVRNKPVEEELQEKMKDNHAIFDKIAQSMNMANAYDFGSIAMNKKFDDLEAETSEDFTKKVTELIGDEEEKEKEKETPSYIPQKKDDNVLTEDFLKDIDKLNNMSSEKSKNEIDAEDATIINETEDTTETPKKVIDAVEPKKEEEGVIVEKDEPKFSKQSSFNSTISIKKRNLKSRVFPVSNFVELTVDSEFIPSDCKSYSHINVTLTKVNTLFDDEISTKHFEIGVGGVTKKWSGLESGDYFLRFWFTENINHNCELTGSVQVKT